MNRQSMQRWERPVLYLLLLALTLVLGTILWNLDRTRTARSVASEPLVIGMSLEAVAATPFETVTGDVIVLEAFFDQPGLLIFLHSECPYCQLDVPLWQALAQETKTLGVAEATDIEGVRAFAQRHNLPFPILVDTEGVLATRLRAFLTPTKVALSPDLRVLQLWEGYTTRQSGQAEIGSLFTLYGIEPTSLPLLDGSKN